MVDLHSFCVFVFDFVISFIGASIVLTVCVVLFSCFLEFCKGPLGQHCFLAYVVMASLGACCCLVYSHVLSQVELVDSRRRIGDVSLYSVPAGPLRNMLLSLQG